VGDWFIEKALLMCILRLSDEHFDCRQGGYHSDNAPQRKLSSSIEKKVAQAMTIGPFR